MEHSWPNGPVCPHCGATAEKIGRLAGVRSKPSKKNPEGVVQIGLRKCYACRGPAFTVRKGTIFEDSHLPLHMWLQAIHLLCASKKGIATRQLHRMLGCGLKTAWHLGHRIREMMTPDKRGPMGGAGKTVEDDDMELGRSTKTKRPPRDQRPKNVRVLSLVERGGPIRSMVIDHCGIGGVYQHIDAKHFDRYLAEFDFRMNTRAKFGIDDVQRAAMAVKGAQGKRLKGAQITKLTITKLNAGKRQLNAAISLWFEDGDPVSIHTLALASHDIIHHVFRRKGFRGLMFDTPMVRPEYRKKWASGLKAAANFFKHGRHDEDKILEFDTAINEIVLIASCHGLSRIGEKPSMEQLAFAYWVLFTQPGLFADHDREKWLISPKIKAHQDLATHGPQFFLRNFEAAWNAGYIGP
jgi:hypothetical protein